MDTRLRLWPSPIRLLLVLNPRAAVDGLNAALELGNFIKRVAHSAEDMRVVLREWTPHLTVIDLDRVIGEPIHSLTTVVSLTNRSPIVALTRQGDLTTTLAAFDHGADDVLAIPFHPAELTARIFAVLRRADHANRPTVSMMRLGDLELDILNRRVRIGNRDLHLTALDQRLLCVLALNAGRVLSRDEILDELWGVDYVADSNVVDRHIRNLRLKLKDDWRRPRYIATVPGRGYCFVRKPKESVLTPPPS